MTEEGFVADELSGVSPIIVDLAGRFYKAEEIHRVLCEDLEVTKVTINQIKKKKEFYLFLMNQLRGFIQQILII